jgi:small subunit ribosomal protein S4
MGKPKFSRKKYETPSHPWQEDRIKEENELIRKYGLKNKREVWKSQTRLRKYRSQARELLAKVETGDAQSKKESQQLLMHLNRLNVLPPNSTLDDVLTLSTESILSRRLQTLTYLKGLANTSYQARQLISHGHIAISDRRVTVPGYIVTKDEEGDIGYTSDSPLNDVMHPARPRADFKSSPIVKKEIIKDEKKPTESPKVEQKEKPTKPQEKEEKKVEEKKKEESSQDKPIKQEEVKEDKNEKPEEKKEIKENENKKKGD